MYRDVKENPFEETDSNEAVALTGEVNPHFGELKKWFLDVTYKPVVCTEDRIGENHLLAQVSLCNSGTKGAEFLGCSHAKLLTKKQFYIVDTYVYMLEANWSGLHGLL